MSFPPPPPEESLEERLSRWCRKEDLKRTNLIIPYAQCAELASMYSPCSNEASPGSHDRRGFKSITPRTPEKMGSRPRPAVKHPRQPRQTSKGLAVVVPVDASQFKEMVYVHTSMHASSPMVDITAQHTCPLTPHSESSSSALDLMSQPCSPATPYSIQSRRVSPLSSPVQGGHSNYGTYVNSPQLPLPGNIDESSLFCATHPDLGLCCDTNLLCESNLVAQCAPTPCLGISSEAENGPPDDWGWPYEFTLEGLLNVSPRYYEKQLSLERLVNDVWAEDLPRW